MTHSHKAMSVHCASSLECNIKVYITGTCKRGALGIHVDYIMELCNQNKFFSLKCFIINPWEWGKGGREGGLGNSLTSPIVAWFGV